MKKAILTVSFGVSSADADKKCIRPVEKAVADAFPDHTVFRAFSSRMIVRRLRACGGIIETEEEALARLKAEDYEISGVVATNIIPGFEYEKVRLSAAGLSVSKPLIACDDDIDWMARLLNRIAEDEGRPLLMMGHGTDHAAGDIYARLCRRLPENVFLACVEGEFSLDKAICEIEGRGIRELTMMPLMLTAGSHARDDMAGDGAESWKSVLAARGFSTRIRMQGLGEFEEVQTRFVEKARRALKA